MSSSVGEDGKSAALDCAAPAGTNEPPAATAVAVATAVEELDVVGDDLDRLALAGAVLRLPLTPLEPAVDATRRPLARYCAQLSPWLPHTYTSK